MAYLMNPLTPDEVKTSPIGQVRLSYNKLAEQFNKILNRDIVFCPKCNEFKSRKEAFYMDKSNKSGLACFCKKCLQDMACDYIKSEDRYVDNKQKAQDTLRFLNRPYIDSLYNSCVQSVQENLAEKNRSAGWLSYYTTISSLPNYKNLTWENSEFASEDSENPDFEIKEVKKTIKSAKKRFGDFYSNQDLMYLENEYQDWITRYECQTKAQEELFESLALNRLQKLKAVKQGNSTKDLDKTFQELLNTQNITPKQQVTDPTSNAQTLGTLIQRWEETKPLPDVDPELEDVDKIGMLIEVFFRGHIAKVLGLKNTFSYIYENYMKKFTVGRPEYDEESDSEAIFDMIFGTREDD